MNQSEIDKISELVINKFHNLPKKGKPSSTEWTTLAGIVQETKAEDAKSLGELYKVVSLGTGTKCVGASELSPIGDKVSDCHAEVLARRAFLLYLYDQINLALLNQQSIFIIAYNTTTSTNAGSDNIDNDTDSKQDKQDLTAKPIFTLRQGITFHLFVSHLPCGDSCIIIPPPDETYEEGTPGVKRRKLHENVSETTTTSGVNVGSRTGAKLKSGPLVYEEVQEVGKCRVKPGKGDPTLCMSCSDKIAKWQILGLQGSLLGNVIPVPIRLLSLTIGSSVPFRSDSLGRAVYNRFHSRVQEMSVNFSETFHLLDNYRVPVVSQASVNFMTFNGEDRKPKTPSPASIVWYWERRHLEEHSQVIVNGRRQGATKKNFGKLSSMVDVCRSRLFTRFKTLAAELNLGQNVEDLNYKEVKKMNHDYDQFWTSLKSEVFTGWTEKPDVTF